jgi:hypothetical protein
MNEFSKETLFQKSRWGDQLSQWNKDNGGMILEHWTTAQISWKFRLIDWLISYGFTSRSRIFHLYGDVTIAGEGLQI